MPIRRALIVAASGLAAALIMVVVAARRSTVSGLLDGQSGDVREYITWMFARPFNWEMADPVPFADEPVDTGSLMWPYLLRIAVYAVLLAGLTFFGVRALDPVRGWFGGLLVGWGASVLAVLAGGASTALLVNDALGMPEEFEISNGFLVIQESSLVALHGVFFGWVVGLAVAGAFWLTRQRPALTAEVDETTPGVDTPETGEAAAGASVADEDMPTEVLEGPRRSELS